MKRNFTNTIIAFFLCLIIPFIGFTPVMADEETREDQSEQIWDASINPPTLYSLQAVSGGVAESRVYSFCRNELGLNVAAAAGVLANIEAESNFSSTAHNKNDTGGTESYGICQWNNGAAAGNRLGKLKTWCSQNGYDYTTLEAQLKYMKHELETDSYLSYSYYKGVANTPAGARDASLRWSKFFEGCASSYYESRANRAQNVFFPHYATDIHFTLTFNANGGSVSPGSQTVSYGQTASLPEPSRETKKFEGWWTSPDGGTQVTNSTPIYENMTLYAHWSCKHDFSDTSIAVIEPATCQKPGAVYVVCKYCGYKKKEGDIPIEPHEYGDWETVEQATCENGGTRKRICKNCSKEETETVEPLGHDYESVTLPADCQHQERIKKTCSRCGKEEITVIDPDSELGDHVWHEWEVKQAPDCENTGLRIRKCKICETEQQEVISALGHSYVNGTCERCGKKESSNYQPGDIDGNNSVNALDLLRLKKYLAGDTRAIVGNGDLNGDGKVNALDLLRLKKLLANKGGDS